MKTGLVLRVPEADALAANVQAFAHAGVPAEMPAHVTVLFPFRDWEEIGRPAIATLERLFRESQPFELTFRKVERFPGVVWLSPEPRAEVDRLTRRVFEAFPDRPPYGGQFEDPTPHLTLVQGGQGLMDEAFDYAASLLSSPIRANIRRCVLFGLTADGWRPQLDFALGRSA